MKFKFFYDKPTQVKFKESPDAVDEPRWIGGIAIEDKIICCECGHIVALADVEEIVELPWVNISEEILGEEG